MAPSSRAALLWVGLTVLGCDGDSDDTGDTADTNDTADTSDTSDTSDTADTSDTSDTSDTDTGDTAVPDCFDGAHNGDETDVDCGGPCAIDCGIDETCATDGDCMFGNCESLACAGPDDGPEPSGAVTASLVPEGGTITVVTDESVTLAIDFPAGAVGAPVELTFTPGTPGAGEWVDVAVGSEGVLLAQPVTITVTLPAGLSLTSDATTTFADAAAGGEVIPLPTTATAGVATTEVQFLGSPDSDPSVFRTDWTGFQIELQSLALRRLITELTDRIDDLETQFAYADAVAARMELIAVLQRTADPDFETLVPPLMADIKQTACEELDGELFILSGGDIYGSRCNWEALKKVEPVLGWAAVGQHVGTYGDACPTLDNSTWLEPVNLELRATIANIQSNEASKVAAYRTCLCESANPSPPPPATCARSGEDDVLLSARVQDVPNTEEAGVRIGVLGATGAADAWSTELAAPYREDVHRRAWIDCNEDDEQWALAALGGTVTDPAPFLTDVQYCATTLDVAVKDSGGGVVDSATAGGIGAGQFTDAVGVTATNDHTIELSGSVSALRCGTPPEADADEIVVKKVAGTTTEIARQGDNAGGYLLDGAYSVAIDVEDQRQGLADTDPLVLEVWRESPACGGAYGPDEFLLATVESGPPVPMTVTVPIAAAVSYFDSSSYVLNPTLPLTVAGADGTTHVELVSPTRVEGTFERTVAAGADPDHWFQGTVDLRIEFGVPGTVTMEVHRITGTQSMDDAWAFPTEEGVFADAPTVEAQGLVRIVVDCEGFYHHVYGACVFDGNPVRTVTFPVPAGSGRVRLHHRSEPANGLAKSGFSVEFTPDP